MDQESGEVSLFAVPAASNAVFTAQAYAELLGFVQILNEAVVGKKISDNFAEYPVSSGNVFPTHFQLNHGN